MALSKIILVEAADRRIEQVFRVIPVAPGRAECRPCARAPESVVMTIEPMSMPDTGHARSSLAITEFERL
jgi:hypothetical protein